MGDFFSRLEASASESPGAVLFLFWSSSFMETLAPSVRMGSVGGPRPPVLSSPVSSFRAPGKVRPGASFPIPDCPNPQGRGAEHRINFAFVSQSWSKSKLSEITS